MSKISIDEVYKRVRSKDLPLFLSKLEIESKDQNIVRSRGSILSLNETLYFIEKNKIKKAKQKGYTVSYNEFYRYSSFQNLDFLYNHLGLNALTCSIMSDCETIIQKFANAGRDLNIPRRNKGSLNLMLQCAMRDDEAALREAMGIYEKYQLKKEWNELQLAFYEAYLQNDEEKIKEVLTKLETPKLKKQSIFYGEFIDDYLSVLTTAYLKLCWRKGMKIHIDSKTVPMQMMPVEPLEEYKIEYPYLEGWENDDISVIKVKEEKKYEAVGPYPTSNPVLRSKFVNEKIVKQAVDHFCPKHSDEEKESLATMIWEAYTDPEHFDLNHPEYVQKNASWPLDNAKGERVLEARPFWSELTEYDDEGFFMYCTGFIIMNEMSMDIDEVYAYLEELKDEIEDKGGFFKRLFS